MLIKNIRKHELLNSTFLRKTLLHWNMLKPLANIKKKTSVSPFSLLVKGVITLLTLCGPETMQNIT